MINGPSVWSVFFLPSAHTAAEMCGSIFTQKCMEFTLLLSYTSSCTTGEKHTRTDTRHQRAVFQRIEDEKCLSSTLLLANLHGEWRGID